MPLDKSDATRIVQVESRDDIPLGGHYIPAEPGDWLMTRGDDVAVVSQRHATVIAFGGRAGPNGMVELTPSAFEAFDNAKARVEEIIALDGVLYTRKRLHESGLRHHIWMSLIGGRTMKVAAMLDGGTSHAITLGERWAWSNTPTWVEGHGFMFEGGSYAGAFIARESAGIAYAACEPGSRINAKFASAGLAGFHRSARTGERRISLEPGQASPLRVIALGWSHASLGDAAVAPCLSELPKIDAPSADARWLEVSHCETEAAYAARLEVGKDDKPRTAGKPFARFLASDAAVIPSGCARVRLASPGHKPGAWVDPRGAVPPEAPVAGELRWKVGMPAKIELTSLGKTKKVDWGEDLAGGAARNYVYAERDGAHPVPPGRYRVRVSRGFEFTVHRENITVAADKPVTVEAKLERVVDTRGFISADLHVHAMPSWDAPVLLEDRVRSLAGAGVEVAVATDHNAVTDYAPAIAALSLGDHIASIVGDEVTTEETFIGHFNVFPLAAGSAPLAWRDVSPQALFTAARTLSPSGVLQVNHPRMGSIGYFELLHLDRGDVPAWTADAPLADMSFDAIEVFSGDHYTKIGEVRWVLDDWFALLNAGLRYTATGNSDSHKIAYQEAGMPRNWVAVSDDAPAAFDETQFIAAVRQGRVIVSSGPFIRFDAGTILEPGERELSIEVDAPPWIDVRDVELIKNGHVIQRWRVETKARPRFATRYTTSLKAGDWLVVTAGSPKSMTGFYRKSAKPFAFTNPVFVR